MGLIKFVVFILISFSVSSSWAGGLEAPPLRVMPYEQLRFPVRLDKKEVQWMLQRAMDEMYGKSFVDIGDVTDLMHGHVIFQPIKGLGLQVLDKYSLEQMQAVELAQNPNMEPVAILFHTHEYDNLRKGMPYIGPYGELDAYNRNWVLFLVDTPLAKRGQILDANSLDSANDKVYTINADEIRDDVFGFEIGDWVYSFYFFRTDCSASDLVTNQETTSLVEVNNAITEERVCLNLTSYHCRNYPEDGKHCSGQEVPLYDIFKGWP